MALWLLGAELVHTRPADARPREAYESATIDSMGCLVVTTSDRKTIVVPKRGDQTSFEDPIISADRTAVGVQADFPNAATSYDIPLELVVVAKGKVHRFRGIELPIFRWHFADSGGRVAYSQETVHFSCSTHYELREIRSERLIESTDVPEPCGEEPNPPEVKIPKWVAELEAKTK